MCIVYLRAKEAGNCSSLRPGSTIKLAKPLGQVECCLICHEQFFLIKNYHIIESRIFQPINEENQQQIGYLMGLHRWCFVTSDTRVQCPKFGRSPLSSEFYIYAINTEFALAVGML